MVTLETVLNSLQKKYRRKCQFLLTKIVLIRCSKMLQERRTAFSWTTFGKKYLSLNLLNNHLKKKLRKENSRKRLDRGQILLIIPGISKIWRIQKGWIMNQRIRPWNYHKVSRQLYRYNSLISKKWSFPIRVSFLASLLNSSPIKRWNFQQMVFNLVNLSSSHSKQCNYLKMASSPLSRSIKHLNKLCSIQQIILCRASQCLRVRMGNKWD